MEWVIGPAPRRNSTYATSPTQRGAVPNTHSMRGLIEWVIGTASLIEWVIGTTSLIEWVIGTDCSVVAAAMSVTEYGKKICLEGLALVDFGCESPRI